MAAFSDTRSSADSCVVGNGIPRSGTYLVNNILHHLGGWENIGVHINPRTWDTWKRDDRVTLHPCTGRLALNKLRNGQMAGAHLPWSKGLDRAMGRTAKDRRIKHILIHRDPRDTFLSYLNWVTKSDAFLTSAGGKEFRGFMLTQFENDDQRLSYIIEQPQHDPAVYDGYHPWLDSPNCLAVRFEDLYPELYELRFGRVGPVFDGLLRYLEVDVSGVDLVEFSNQVHGMSNTEIGRYKNIYKDRHFAQIDTPAFRNSLERFGYAW